MRGAFFYIEQLITPSRDTADQAALGHGPHSTKLRIFRLSSDQRSPSHLNSRVRNLEVFTRKCAWSRPWEIAVRDKVIRLHFSLADRPCERLCRSNAR